MSRRKRTCSGAGCGTKIPQKMFLCPSCFAKLPKAMKARMSKAFKVMDGAELMAAKKDAAAYLERLIEDHKDRKKMATGKSDLVDVILEARIQRGAAQAFFQGDQEEDRDGNMRENWIWLPLSQIEVVPKEGTLCTVTMPEWLAHEKGLI